MLWSSLELVIFAISGIGAVLLTLFFAKLLTFEQHQKLNKHHKKDTAVADLLNYAAVVADGVVVGKNGALTAAWLYKGNDDASSTSEQREQVSKFINQALARLGNGWMIHVDAVRREAVNYSDPTHSHFTDAICAGIDANRRNLFQSFGTMYDGYFVLSLTYFAPHIAQQKFTDLMFDDPDKEKKADLKTRTTNILKQFERECASFESDLSLALQVTRLKSYKVRDAHNPDQSIAYDDLLSWLNTCVTGDYQSIRLPSNPIYLDAILGNQELHNGLIPKLGNKYIQVVAIDGFPFESYPGILASLAELPCDYRWNTRFIFLDQHESIAHFEKYRRKWQQKVRGIVAVLTNNPNAPVNQDALLMVEDAESALADVHSGLVAAGYYTSVIVIRDQDPVTLEHASKQVQKAITRLGFTARIETINTMDAFFGSLPSHGVENVRRPLLNTMNLADLIPTSSIWTGDANCPNPMYPQHSPALMQCVTSGATPFRLNLHVRDVGHTLMLGPTGAGKSTHLALLVAQLRRYQGMTIFAFDKGMSLYPLTSAINAVTNGHTGLHFAVGSDHNSLSFCPLQFLDSASDQAFALEWIETILALNGVNITPSQRNDISGALTSMYHSTSKRSLSNFLTTVQDNAIRESLKQYTIDPTVGKFGYLFDAEQDGLHLHADLTVFEIEDLMNLGEKYALPALLYIFRRIETSLHGQPAVIILDEAWLMLAHPVFREKIREWLKVLRKANCAVIMATQSLSDALRSGILDVLVESTATKIFLPNVYALDEDTSALYRRMGLNKRQISILASSVPKRDYYYVSEHGRRLYSLALDDFALAFVGASDKDTIARIQSLQKTHGHNWVDYYLHDQHLTMPKVKLANTVDAK